MSAQFDNLQLPRDDLQAIVKCSPILTDNLRVSLSDIFTSASSSHDEFDEEVRIIRAVQESMQQHKLRSSHRQKRQANVVCYGALGCFEDSGPFGYIDMLPQSPEEIDTKFYVFSTKNRYDLKTNKWLSGNVAQTFTFSGQTIHFFSFHSTTFRHTHY